MTEQRIADITRKHFGSERGAVLAAHGEINRGLAPDNLDYSTIYAYFSGLRKPRTIMLRLLAQLPEGDRCGDWARECLLEMRPIAVVDNKTYQKHT